jgi:hypothetical protein
MRASDPRTEHPVVLPKSLSMPCRSYIRSHCSCEKVQVRKRH